MTPLKMLLLVTLLLGSCLQDSHAGESRGQEGWGPRDHSSYTHVSVCFLHHIYSYQDVGGWWQEAFKGGIQGRHSEENNNNVDDEGEGGSGKAPLCLGTAWGGTKCLCTSRRSGS